MRRAAVAVVGLAVLALPLPAAAVPEVVDTPRGRVAGPAYLAGHYGRLADQVRHRDYAQRLAAEREGCEDGDTCAIADPYVAAWTRTHLQRERGTLPEAGAAYELLAPRPGARSPVDGRPLRAPYPGVVLLPGGGTPKEVYRGAAQGLAAAGYVVVSVDPACNLGPCGQDPRLQDAVLDTGAALADLAVVVASVTATCVATGCDYTPLAAAYTASEATYQEAGVAALRLLASRPSLADRERTAVVGHSLGAYGAALLAQRTGLPARVRAAVAWDGYGFLPADVRPRVPVQFQAYEGQDLTPHPVLPDETPSHANAARLRAARVPTGVVALRSSAHYEIGHVPPDRAGASSRHGERVALDATLSWLDAHVAAGAVAARGRAALLSPRLSRAVDTVAHGQGAPAADGSNVPYTVGGDRRADHLSLLLRSWYDLADGTACADVVAGC